MKRLALVAWILLAVALPASPTAQPPVFQVRTADGKTVQGRLLKLDAGRGLTLSGEQSFTAAQWLSLRRQGGKLPPFPDAESLILGNGDRLAVSGIRLAGRQLVFTHPRLSGGKESRLSLTSVSVLWLAPGGDQDGPRLRRTLSRQKRRQDAIILRNEDQLEGTLENLDDRQIKVRRPRELLTLDRKRVTAIARNSELTASARPTGAHFRLVLADGSRLTLTAAACKDGQILMGTTQAGLAVETPLEEVAALDLLQVSAVYLSDLEPLHYKHTSYLGVSWPLVRDGNVTGGDLRLPDGVHDRGLGLHSACEVTYAVPDGVKAFEALVGLDDPGGRKGSVRLKVLLDGREKDVGLREELTFARSPVLIRLDVAGGKRLTLVVEFGARGDVGDHVNLADARFVK